MPSTNSEALQAIRQLNNTDTGRLRGLSLRYRYHDIRPQMFATTPQPWREQLTAALDIEQRTVDSPFYLALSDRLPVVWLTMRGQVVIPGYPVTPIQARHQQQATAALGDLARWALSDLADLRAHLDGDTATPAAEYADQPGGALRIASCHEPTATSWVTIGADLTTAQAHIGQVCPMEELLVMTAVGYGVYGRDRHRLQLPMLCAMHQLADTHRVSLATVGNWLDAEAATAVDLDPQQVMDEFADAYLGPFPSSHAYTAHRMAELGWAQAIAAAGIPTDYLDTRAINRDLFSRQVREIHPGTGRHIEVFRRRPTDQ